MIDSSVQRMASTENNEAIPYKDFEKLAGIAQTFLNESNSYPPIGTIIRSTETKKSQLILRRIEFTELKQEGETYNILYFIFEAIAL